MIGPAGQRAYDLLSVDPGVEYFAWARWQDSTLVEAGLDRDNRYLTNRFPDTTTVVVELTQTRTGDRKKQKQIDGLIRAAGEIAGQFPNGSTGYRPCPRRSSRTGPGTLCAQKSVKFSRSSKRRTCTTFWMRSGTV